MVSNLGAYGVEHFVAIINPPEAEDPGDWRGASAGRQGRWDAGVGNRMKVTISVDHRVSDGAEGASFMQKFKALMEEIRCNCCCRNEPHPGNLWLLPPASWKGRCVSASG
ncbi:MAG: 2-oxo acid dehydrogenase subunit E2 [Anaerolineae bacterium]